jgi:multisubunit Na+/H+ antiporter MnhB subunit
MLKRFISTLVFICFALAVKAEQNQVEMADLMRSNGKIYVVVLVIATIFAGIILYLIRLDRKIGRLENSENQK